jgi:hypothetical protein
VWKEQPRDVGLHPHHVIAGDHESHDRHDQKDFRPYQNLHNF